MTLRALHISDVHVDVPLSQIPLRDWLGKRLIGGANLVLRRRRHFRHTHEKLQALDRFRREQGVDLVLCTGDYTALGSWAELRAARAAIGPLAEARLGFATVPGNHDVYVPDAAREGRFEATFGDLLRNDLPEHATPDGWPRVLLAGGEVAVVAVSSARPNPQPWRSSGAIPAAQIAALERVLADERVAGRFVFVITHYAPRLADGRPDRHLHGLDNADALLRACRTLERGALLHGHVHRCYRVLVPELRVPIFGAGSTTQEGREGLWLFELGPRGRAIRGTWAGDRYVLTDEAHALGW